MEEWEEDFDLEWGDEDEDAEERVDEAYDRNEMLMNDRASEDEE